MSSNRQLAPFIHTQKTAPYIYLTYVVGLTPLICFAVFYYGLRAIVLIGLSALLFSLFDNVFSKYVRRDPHKDYFDISSIVSGIVFALMMPPNASIHTLIMGVLFGSVVAKQFFGGAGNNIVNTACAARLFVGICFPSRMLGFATPGKDWFMLKSLIGMGGNTVAGGTEGYHLLEIICGKYSWTLGTGCSILILIGGVYLAIKGTVRLYAPITYILSLMVLYPLFNLTRYFSVGGIKDFAIFLISSGVLFVAVFMLGDYTTMPSRFIPAIFSGFICALLTMILRGHVNEDVMLLVPVMLVNIQSFVIDYFYKSLTRKPVILSQEDEFEDD